MEESLQALTLQPGPLSIFIFVWLCFIIIIIIFLGG